MLHVLAQIYVSALAVWGGGWCALGLLGALDDVYRNGIGEDRPRFCLIVSILLAGICFAIGTVDIVWA